MLARITLKSLTKTKWIVGVGLIVAGGAFAACGAASDDASQSSAQNTGNSLPYLVKPCPGNGCK